MSQGVVTLFECDSCGKTAESPADVRASNPSQKMPRGWKRLTVRDHDVTKEHQLEACSPGCAEKAAGALIRTFYEMPMDVEDVAADRLAPR